MLWLTRPPFAWSTTVLLPRYPDSRKYFVFIQVTTSFYLSRHPEYSSQDVRRPALYSPSALGVALLGLLITAMSLTLHLLPYIIFFSIIDLSIWVPSRPVDRKNIHHSAVVRLMIHIMIHRS